MQKPRTLAQAAESQIAISVVLNVHREVIYYERTMRSLVEAVEYAKSFNLSVELVVVQDRPDQRTVNWFDAYDYSAFSAHQIITVENGSLGLSRNDGIRVARGEYIATYDADDLVSFNWLARQHEEALRAGRRALIFAQYLIGFGFMSHLVEYFDQKTICNLAYMDAHPYGSRVFGHRSIFEEVPYGDVRLTSGYAYEDWHFNAEVLARGIEFHIAPDVILYYRQRPNSLLKSANNLSARQIPPTKLFEPEIYRAVCATDYGRWARGDLARTTAPEIRERFLGSPLCIEATQAANRIDPTIDIGLIPEIEAFSNLEGYYRLGAAYYELTGLLSGRRFTDVVLLPFLTTGGGDKYILNVLAGLAELDPDREFLVLTGEGGVHHRWLDKLPDNTLFLDLFHRFDALSREELETLTLRLIESTAGRATLHLKSSVYCDRFFRRYGQLLKANRKVYYRFADALLTFEGRQFLRGYSFGFISDVIEDLDMIVSDNKSIGLLDQARFGVESRKWSHLYTRCDPIITPEQLEAEFPKRGETLLWASRLDLEKRPELLIKIAAAYAQYLPGVTIDVYGRPVLDSFDTSRFEDLPNIRYRGEYWDFVALSPERYGGFLYTTAYDGLPNVVLEALAAGLPVIAPNIGGLKEAVIDGETGILIEDDPDDEVLLERYVTAGARLFGVDDERRAMSRNALVLVRDRHAKAAFLNSLSELFSESA